LAAARLRSIRLKITRNTQNIVLKNASQARPRSTASPSERCGAAGAATVAATVAAAVASTEAPTGLMRSQSSPLALLPLLPLLLPAAPMPLPPLYALPLVLATLPLLP